tara:strand:+ start:715 stop:1125 length:411 start_codon:yes stop_codon:yes gene_type:complete
MSDYTIAVNWSGKDSLSDSDSAKVISGADFNTEFTTARTAINSKADLNGDSGEDFAGNNVTVAGNTTIGGTLAVTGVATAPTAATSTNTTQVATTAFTQAAIDADVTTHAALRSSQTVYGHAKIYTSGGDLYIVTT